MIDAKFSTRYHAVKARIRRLPKLIDDTADTFSKKDAVALIDTYREGLRDNSFGLIKLEPRTIYGKARSGYNKPNTPLYGAGDEEDNSYINMFKIRKIKNGYRVYPRWAKHHKSGLPLRVLFEIHERGALIRQPNGAIVRIPPRPAFSKAFNRHLRRRKKEENVQEVKNAMMDLINKGRDTKLRRLGTKNKEIDKYDET